MATSKEKEYSYRTRLMRIVRALIERPYGYTKRDLAEIYNTHLDSISGDFTAIRNAGFTLKHDKRYRYAFALEKPYKTLKDLLHFSEEDQVLLHDAIDQIAPNDERGRNLKKKLASLYDYKRLGHSYLRKPYLAKVDILTKAKDQKRQVILQDYRSSNSNLISNRQVEPFHIEPADDTFQSFDIGKKEIRHFRISRIRKVQLLDTPWQHEGHHNIMRADPFRIVDNRHVMVHITLSVAGYNELISRYPRTKAYIEESQEDEIYDFQCKVNHRFLGLSNFILGNYRQVVEIIHPESLTRHLDNEINAIKSHFF